MDDALTRRGTLGIGLRSGCTGRPGLGADGVGACVQAFIRAVMCNWLVCMALWLATSASTLGSKFMGIWLPISAFAAIGLEHCVANMCAPALVQRSQSAYWMVHGGFCSIVEVNPSHRAIHVAAQE